MRVFCHHAGEQSELVEEQSQINAKRVHCFGVFTNISCNLKYIQHRMCSQVAATLGHRSSFVQTMVAVSQLSTQPQRQ